MNIPRHRPPVAGWTACHTPPLRGRASHHAAVPTIPRRLPGAPCLLHIAVTPGPHPKHLKTCTKMRYLFKKAMTVGAELQKPCQAFGLAD